MIYMFLSALPWSYCHKKFLDEKPPYCIDESNQCLKYTKDNPVFNDITFYDPYSTSTSTKPIKGLIYCFLNESLVVSQYKIKTPVNTYFR